LEKGDFDLSLRIQSALIIILHISVFQEAGLVFFGLLFIAGGIVLFLVGRTMPANRVSDRWRANIGAPILILVGILILTGVIHP
jgi:hypothetical protein